MVLPAARVVSILALAATAGVAVWLDGGWGVDALLGRQQREHEDVDLVVPLSQVPQLLAALESQGFVTTEDHLPTRLVLRASREQIDLHPVTFDSSGDAWQARAAPDGADCRYPADGFVIGMLGGEQVPCVGLDVQVEHHSGYVPRLRDREDMLRLKARFGIPLPSNYERP